MPLQDIEPPMIPFRGFVVDVTSRCDLACPNCNIFFGPDQGWTALDRAVELPKIEQTARRINEHARSNNLSDVDVTLFGGEPLMRGAASVRDICAVIQNNTPDVQVGIGVTTNGIRLRKDQELRDAIGELGIRVAFSLDGYKEANDRSRVHHGGGGTFDEIVESITIFSKEHPELYAGILHTLTDPHIDPVRTYETIVDLKPPRTDFLLNHMQTGTVRPPKKFEDRPTDTPYGNWLIRAFDRYLDRPKDEWQTEVRLFHSIMVLCMGGQSMSEAVGLAPTTFITVATDGSIRLDSAFNAAYDGAAKTGLNVFEHSFDEALRHPAVVKSQLGKLGLSQTCQQCPIVDKCGAGLPAHRFWNETSTPPPAEYVASLFDFPSRYCADLAKLIMHIDNRIAPYVPSTENA